MVVQPERPISAIRVSPARKR